MVPLRVGVDSYSYHRLLGEVRQGEAPSPVAPFRAGGRGTLDALAAIRTAGAELASLETVFLPPPGRVDRAALLEAADGLELALAWGHPDGLAWGVDTAAQAELRAWIRRAPQLGVRLVRLVAASPRLRNAGTVAEQLDGTARAVGRALEEAAAAGVELAIENHGDLTAAMLAELLDRCPGLGVCFDTANALRVGDDPVAAAAQLVGAVRMVHLKDCTAPAPHAPLCGPRSVPYGDGVIDLEGVLEALRPALGVGAGAAGVVGVAAEAGAAGIPVCVELAQLGPEVVDERGLVADGVAWLRRWRAAAALAA